MHGPQKFQLSLMQQYHDPNQYNATRQNGCILYPFVPFIALTCPFGVRFAPPPTLTGFPVIKGGVV